MQRHAEGDSESDESGKAMENCGEMIRWKSMEVPQNERLRSTLGYFRDIGYRWIQMNTNGCRILPKDSPFLFTTPFSVILTFGTFNDQILKSEALMGRTAQTLSFGAWVLCSIGSKRSVFLSPQRAELMAFLTFYIWYRYDILYIWLYIYILWYNVFLFLVLNADFWRCEPQKHQRRVCGST